MSSSVWYVVVRKVSMSLSVRNEESSRRDFIRPLRCRREGEHVRIRLVQGIKKAGLHLSDTKSQEESLSMSVRYEESRRRDYIHLIQSHERRACPRPFGTRNQAGRTSSIRYKVAQKEDFFSSIRYEESSWWDFVRPVRSRVNGGHVLVRPIRSRVKGGLAPSVRYDESCRLDIVHLVQSRTKGGLFLIRPV